MNTTKNTMDLSELSQFPIACVIVPDEGKLKLWSEQLYFCNAYGDFPERIWQLLNPIGVWQDVEKPVLCSRWIDKASDFFWGGGGEGGGDCSPTTLLERIARVIVHSPGFFLHEGLYMYEHSSLFVFFVFHLKLSHLLSTGKMKPVYAQGALRRWSLCTGTGSSYPWSFDWK